MVTEVVTGPVAGEIVEITGPGLIVKATTGVVTPPTLTATLTTPVPAPGGGRALICVAVQTIGFAAMPLKVTVLFPCGNPKGPPLICTEVPTVPEVGDKLVMVGLTANEIPFVAKVSEFDPR